MNRHAPLSLDEKSAAFVEQQLESGNFDSANEVVQAGLRLLEEQQHLAQVERLRAAIVEGEQSGEPQPFDFDAFLERKRRERGL